MSEANSPKSPGLVTLVNQISDGVAETQETLVYLRSALDYLSNQESPDDNPNHLFAHVVRGMLIRFEALERNLHSLKQGIKA